MSLLENIVVRQLSYFIQFIHISFKDPLFISSDHQILPTLCLIKFCSVLFINYNRYLFWCQSFGDDTPYIYSFYF